MTLLLCKSLNEVRSVFGMLNYVYDVAKKATFAIVYPEQFQFLVTVLLSVADPVIWNGVGDLSFSSLPPLTLSLPLVAGFLNRARGSGGVLSTIMPHINVKQYFGWQVYNNLGTWTNNPIIPLLY